MPAEVIDHVLVIIGHNLQLFFFISLIYILECYDGCINSSHKCKAIDTNKTDISGVHTEVVVNKFEDHLFIIATQYLKIGTLVQVTRDVISDEVQGHIPMFSTKVLLGKDEPLTHVMARTIVASINPPIPVILSLALKTTSHEDVQALIAMIKSCL